jgi:pyrroline-5-carboxylate reductase
MSELKHKIGFIGAGNMGQAMIGALIKSGCSEADNIFASDPFEQVTDAIKQSFGVTILPNNSEIIQQCDVIIFAVKPQSIKEVLSDLGKLSAFKNITKKKIFISIAAGTRLSKLEHYIYDTAKERDRRLMPVLRVMPNTPALVLSGMSGLCANDYATEEDIEVTKTILSSMGKVIECQESDMDAVTAMSGSGPAYCFYLVEAMIEAGEELGFDAESATKITIETLKGALILLEHQNDTARNLRKKVTSPGGTTEAAINLLDSNSVKQTIIKAILAAAQRSKELSG